MSLFFKSTPLFTTYSEQDLKKAYIGAMPISAATQVSLALTSHYKATEARVRAYVAKGDLMMVMSLLDDMESQVKAMELFCYGPTAAQYKSHLEVFKHHAVANLANTPSTITDQSTIIHSMEEALSDEEQ
jgi:uncharacterized protein YukE